MKGFVSILLLFWGLNASAKLPTMREIFLSLPDSAFFYSKTFTKSKTFSIKDRQQLLNNSDTSVLRVQFESDSLHQLTIAGGDYISIEIKYWVKSEKIVFIAVIESKCDFVMCHQKNSFYRWKKGKLSQYYYNYHETPLKFFFKEDELRKCGFDPEKGCKEYTLSIQNNFLRLNFQEEYLDKELMGEDGKFVCLADKDASLKDSVYVYLYFTGYFFLPIPVTVYK